jgi:hypothetical protein
MDKIMESKKLFTLYIGKENEEVDLNIHVELNLANLVPEDKIDGILTEGELKQLEEITLNICKRVNRVNGSDELKMFNINK